MCSCASAQFDFGLTLFHALGMLCVPLPVSGIQVFRLTEASSANLAIEYALNSNVVEKTHLQYRKVLPESQYRTFLPLHLCSRDNARTAGWRTSSSLRTQTQCLYQCLLDQIQDVVNGILRWAGRRFFGRWLGIRQGGGVRGISMT